MRGGSNKKSIEQHILEGTYRADRHNPNRNTDTESLKKMKLALLKIFDNTKKELSKTDFNGKPDTYKLLHSLLMEQIKTFNSIARNPNNKEEIKDEQITL